MCIYEVPVEDWAYQVLHRDDMWATEYVKGFVSRYSFGRKKKLKAKEFDMESKDDLENDETLNDNTEKDNISVEIKRNDEWKQVRGKASKKNLVEIRASEHIEVSNKFSILTNE